MAPKLAIRREQLQRSDRGAACALVMLGAASILFRLPALLNAAGLNSDAAIVGLQARHILQGEWSWFLWGTNYQGAIDPLFVALAFAIAGPRPLTQMVVPLVGHLLVTWFTFDILRKRLNLALAATATLPLVFAPHAINTVSLYPPRQWSITAVFAAIWLLDRVPDLRRPTWCAIVGAALGSFSLYLDLYAVLFFPALGLFALLCSLDDQLPAAVLVRRLTACAVGFFLGGFLVWHLWQELPSDIQFTATARMTWRYLPHTFDLIWQQCLPWILSAKVFIPGKEIYRLDLWQPPPGVVMIQTFGAATFMVGVLFGGMALARRQIPWPVRRLGVLGCSVTVCTILGFLSSPSTPATGAWSTRFLAPIVWSAPFALAPAAYVLQTKRFALALTPYLIAAAVAGWLSFGDYVHGPLPVRIPRGTAAEEAQLRTVLRQRGIRYAAADYWLAYRLTFLWDEEPVVIPLVPPSGERYPPYQHGFDRATKVAFIFHPYVQRGNPEPYAQWLSQSHRHYERLHVGEFTVFTVHKQPCEYMLLPGRASSC